MDIGVFKGHEDGGFIGYLMTLGLGEVTIVMLPKEEFFRDLELLMMDKTNKDPFRVGTAKVRRDDQGKHYVVELDCPTFAAPIRARMDYYPDRDGLHKLRWVRT